MHLLIQAYVLSRVSRYSSLKLGPAIQVNSLTAWYLVLVIKLAWDSS